MSSSFAHRIVECVLRSRVCCSLHDAFEFRVESVCGGMSQYKDSKQLLSRGLAGGAREEARKQASKGGSEEASMARQGGGTITSNSILE